VAGRSLTIVTGMEVFLTFAAVTPRQEWELVYIWHRATPEGKAIIVILLIFSILAWSVMISKAIQMRRAKRLNRLFLVEFRKQKNVMEIFDRRVHVEGCPLYEVYLAGCSELERQLKRMDPKHPRGAISLTNMEHIKRALENAVAEESLKLESGLILLAIAVSGRPLPRAAGNCLGGYEHLCRCGSPGTCHPSCDGPWRCSSTYNHCSRPVSGNPLYVRL